MISSGATHVRSGSEFVVRPMAKRPMDAARPLDKMSEELANLQIILLL
jgi:hypothetical protein